MNSALWLDKTFNEAMKSVKLDIFWCGFVPTKSTCCSLASMSSISSRFGLQVPPKRHEHHCSYADDSDLQPDIAQHPDLDAGTSPYSPADAPCVVAVLDTDTDTCVPFRWELLGEQAKRDGAREVEPERDQEPCDEQASVVHCARAQDRDGYQQPCCAEGRSNSEGDAVLEAAREEDVGEEERESACTAERDEVSRSEGAEVEGREGRVRSGEDWEVCLPCAEDEEAGHCEPAHRRRDAPLAS